ncbi:MAG: PDZ domain-containing protein, partial [Bacteriovorax sp.]|nr:PDZ domain-containing protein [Bacteriovorax sp.]
YQQYPKRGLIPEQVYKMIEEVGGSEILSRFEGMTSTTEEIDLESLSAKAGLKFEWEPQTTPWTGFDSEFNGDRVMIKAITLDGPAAKAGLNAGDEILAINGIRMLKERFSDYSKFLKVNQIYQVTISRLSVLQTLSLTIGVAPMKLRSISVVDRPLAEKVFLAKN